MPTLRPLCVFIFLGCLTALSQASDTVAGHLLVIGGALRPDNADIYQRLVAYAGGREKARFGLFPIASPTNRPAQQVALALQKYGIPPDRIEIFDLTLDNAAQQAFNPEIVEKIRACTGLYFTGGDQRRIIRALISPDGTERPALKAMRDVVARGGVFAGSSAGAAIQSEIMLCVAGLPDNSIDEGMDALDFGLTEGTARRGLQVSRGLGFFKAGIIDQHFHQYRGRLSRLTRAVIEQKRRYGFGIDENTALDVGPDGIVEVVGLGCLTLVDTADAALTDGPLGCQVRGVRVSSFEEGDRFDITKGVGIPHAGKKPITEGKEANNGNHIIGDISGEDAVYYGLTNGLADNSRRKQVGITLRYNQLYGHGYKFIFSKTDQTKSYAGYANGVWGYTVLGAQLDIEPTGITRQPPDATLPQDLPKGDSRRACEAIVFRGILLADEQRQFRPAEPVTRGELANAIVQTLHVEPPRKDAPAIVDVPSSSPIADDVEKVVAAGLMTLDGNGAFRPESPLTRAEAAQVLALVAESYGGERLSGEPTACDDIEAVAEANRGVVFASLRAGLLRLEKNRFRPQANLTREEAAVALYRAIGFPW